MDSGRNSVSHPNVRMFCLGSHRGPEDDGYVTGTGGRRFKAAYRKRPQDFKRRIIQRVCEGNDRTVFEAEQRWLNLINSEELRLRYYNIKKTAAGFSREDMLQFHLADPTLATRTGQAIRKAFAANPALGKRVSAGRLAALAADPTLAIRTGQAFRAACAADPTIGERISTSLLNTHKNNPEIGKKISAAKLAGLAADPTLTIRIGQAVHEAHLADPTIAQRISVNGKIALGRRTPEQKKLQAERCWAARRANITARGLIESGCPV
jgi:hypothetical protein